MSEGITSYHVEFTSKARKQLKKFDRFDARIIVTWIQKNLEGCEDPRALGKGLTQTVQVNGAIGSVLTAFWRTSTTRK